MEYLCRVVGNLIVAAVTLTALFFVLGFISVTWPPDCTPDRANDFYCPGAHR